MALPPRVFFTLHEAAARWGCNIADIAGWADAGRFRILTGISPVRCGDEIVAGKVVLSPMELLPLFRRCGTGPSEGVIRRICPLNRQDWLLITDPGGGFSVAVADMMILAEEVHVFEEDNDMVRRAAGGSGATSPYDWEGMLAALVVRVHAKGLPATQSELVTEIQDWFADQSDGAKIPDTHPAPAITLPGPPFSPHAPISRPLWASMIASHGRVVSRRILKGRSRRRLNPLFVGWLMGWPIGHALCACSATEFTLWQQRMRGALSRLPMASGPWIWRLTDQAQRPVQLPTQLTLFEGLEP